MQEFNLAWEESYTGESMKYLVFNKLDKKAGIQYYYQNGKLLTRTPGAATQQKIEKENFVEILSKIFGLDKELLAYSECLGFKQD